MPPGRGGAPDRSEFVVGPALGPTSGAVSHGTAVFWAFRADCLNGAHPLCWTASQFALGYLSPGASERLALPSVSIRPQLPRRQASIRLHLTKPPVPASARQSVTPSPVATAAAGGGVGCGALK